MIAGGQIEKHVRLRFLAATLMLAAIVATIVGGPTRVSAADPPPVNIFVQESIGVDDGSDAVPPADVDVAEDIAVSDDPTVIGPAVVDVTEYVAVSDDPTVTPPAVIEVNETILVEDTGGPVSSTPIPEAGPAITVNEGQTVTLPASVITLNPELATAEIDWDDGSTDTVAPTSTGAITVLHLYEGDGVFIVTVTVTGPFGDSGDDTTQVTVLNHAPIVDAGGPYGGNTSDAIVLTAEGSDPGDDPLTYAWDLDDDGQFDDATGQAVIFSSPTPGVFPVTVRATDDASLAADDAVDVTVSGAALAPGPPASDVPPAVTSPVHGSALNTTTVSIVWTANDARVDFWQLDAGTSRGGNDIFKSGTQPPYVSSLNVTLPPSTVHVRLYYFSGGQWAHVDAAYTVPANLSAPEITSPPLGSTLVGGSATFEWTNNGTSITEYRLTVGTAPGLSNIASGNITSALSNPIEPIGPVDAAAGGDETFVANLITSRLTASKLPADGSPVFVRLWWLTGNVWAFADYAYSTAADEYVVPESTPAVDTADPVTTIEFAGAHTYSAGTHFITPDTQIYFLSTDDNPVAIEYSLDNAAFVPAYPFKITQPGLHTVAYFAEDTAGNREDAKIAAVSVSGGKVTSRPAAPDQDESGPAITLRATKVSGDGPVQEGDRILVKATPADDTKDTGTSGSGSGQGDQNVIPTTRFEFDLVTGSGSGYESNWYDIEGGARWVFTVPTGSAGSSLEIQAVAIGTNGVEGPPASLVLIVGQGISAAIASQADVVVEGETLVLQALVQGGSAPFNVTFLQDTQQVSTGSSVFAFTAPAGSAGKTFDFIARVSDSRNATADSAVKQIRVIALPTDPDGPGLRSAPPAAANVGKVSGRAVIGTLVHLSKSLIVVAAGQGPDLTDVRIHVDAAATKIAASLDADAYATGSRVVVVADRDLPDPRAVAISITQTGGPDAKAGRTHKRVVVADPDAGNTLKLADADGAVLDARKSGDIDTGSGDRVVLIVKKDRQGRDADAKIVARTDDVDDRLNKIAQAKSDEGKFDESTKVDRLKEDSRGQDKDRAGRIADHEDDAVRDAGKDAARKIEDAEGRDDDDPLIAIRRHAAADSEEAILVCAAQVVGRSVSGEGDLTAAEKARVEDACLDADERDDQGDRGIPEERDQPPPEVLDCVIQVLGGLPDGPISNADKERVVAACAPAGRDDDRAADDGPGPDDAPASDVDPRKLAYCQANPDDSRCSGDSGGDGGGDEPTTDADKRAYCEANPDDSRCSGDSGGDGGGDNGGSDQNKDADNQQGAGKGSK